MHRLLHLQHHRHTGKLLHHHHTSYRALALILVLTGVVIVRMELSVRQLASADSLLVTATVPAPVPTQPAVITSPADGTTVSNNPITLSGTCQVMSPGIVITLEDNGTLVGSVPCNNQGTFSIPTSLSVGLNTYIARSLTITGDYGPDSTPVGVTYAAANPPASGTSASPSKQQSPEVTPSPLSLTSDESFIVFGPDKAATWTGSISGGVAPYQIQIAWGDNQTTTTTLSSAGKQTFSHMYTAFKSHTIVVTVQDSSGQHVTKWYAAVTPYLAPSIGNILAGTPQGSGTSTVTILVAYCAYLFALGTVGVVWVQGRHHFAYAKAPTAATRHKGRRR